MPRSKTNNFPRGKPRGIRRDRDCQTCKARGVKCDLNRPRCLPCVESGYACGDYPQRVVWAANPTPKPSRAENRSAVIEKSLATDQHEVVEHLLAFGSSLKTVRGSTADSALPTSPSSLSSGEGTQDEDTLMWHRLAALKSLSEALNTADPAAFLGIAVFAFFEVVSDGVFGEWDCHLRGARSLLDCHCSNSEEFQRFSRRFTGLEEIVAYFAWWDTIGALVRQSTSNTKSGLIFDDWHRSSLGQDFFDRVGCPAETFWLFVSLVQSKESTNLSESLTRAMAQLLKLGMDKTEKGKCSDIYRCAAVIAVLTTQSSSNGSEETSFEVTLEFAVDRICHIIESACSRSRYESN
ncbi:hypothetical protein FOC1_g10003804 [Fusarium oxysporum f. sp. cubense race 1]|uniref:Zn(2)-C6 fungal-type domain-containing protein n=1 Tax=Fusarium oxysporum f. sp. cubense (strain race 1) TaxID=1229664 RepID=N4TX32_FUSC1|nr:hypothetical protein FOC1_g10003804 [Fusarium oxysporum f. sp. cubense race 1]